MVTDLIQIRRLAAEKDTENLRFRRYLKAHHVPHRTLEKIAHEVSQHVDCTACANCCRYTEVHPSREDIARLAQYLGIAVEQAIKLYTEPEHSAECGVKLRQPGDACVFLDGNQCLVYDARPRACREFPHVETSGNSLGARMSSVCRSAAFCPICFNALEEYKKVTGFHRPE